MNKVKKLIENIWLPLLILLIGACQNEADKSLSTGPNIFSDTLMIEIHEYQDKRDTESLLKFFRHENAKYRAAAAEAFGSVQDSLAISMLSGLLNDEQSKVRKAAAYALGQSYDSSAIKPLVTALEQEDSLFVRRELIESLGKVITQPKLPILNRLAAESEQEKEGLAWGLYRAGIRGVFDDLSTGTAIVLLANENSYATRLGAANYLARTRNVELAQYLPQIIKSATTDSSANVRMAAVSALGKIQTPSSLQTLLNQSINDVDYRVRVNGLRSLSAFNFEGTKDYIYKKLEDENVNVAITAAGQIRANGENAVYIGELAAKNDDPRVKAMLYSAAIAAADDKQSMSEQVKLSYNQSEDPYYRAQLLSALASHLPNYEFIITETFKAEHKAISTSGAGAIVNMRQSEDFPEELKPAFADILKQLVETNDIAIVAIVSGLFNQEAYNFKDAYDSIGFLYQAKESLTLPKDNEALQVLNKTIALFEGKEELPETKNEYNNPINWDLVKTIPSDQKMKVSTEKGDLVLRLLVDEAPGSVANFYKLATDGYFNNKNFHRVVPNFVVQGGCNRGDGYGGENYSIRSELPNLNYTTGTVGMASAGKDTEGTQWFITHSPTPHLDGRYSIFAQVEEGMDIVHTIEVGDKIKAIEVLNKK